MKVWKEHDFNMIPKAVYFNTSLSISSLQRKTTLDSSQPLPLSAATICFGHGAIVAIKRWMIWGIQLIVTYDQWWYTYDQRYISIVYDQWYMINGLPKERTIFGQKKHRR